MIENSLKRLDIFSTQIKLPISHKKTFKTALGGFQSIIMFILSILLSWLIGQDIIFKQNPLAFMQTLQSKQYPSTVINYNTFPFGINFIDKDNNPLQNFSKFLNFRVHFVKFDYVNGSVIPDIYREEIHLAPCSLRHFPAVSEEDFYSSVLNSFLCPEELNYTLKGYWGESNIHFINLEVHLCDFEKNPELCAAPQEIHEFIKTTKLFQIQYLESFYNLKDFKNPKTSYVKLKYKTLDFTLGKEQTFFLKKIILNTDEGFLFKELKTDDFLLVDEDLIDSYEMTKDKKAIGLFIHPSNLSDNYFREYIKIPNIIAGVGGIIKLLMFVFSLCNRILIDTITHLNIVNEIFRFNLNRNENAKNRKPTNTGTVKLLNTHTINISNMNLIGTNNEKVILPSVITNSPSKYHLDGKKTNNDKLKMSMKDLYLTQCKISKNNIKGLIYQKAILKFNRMFSAINIIKKLEEVEFLKTIIFDKNQLILFQYLSVPEINLFNNSSTTNIKIEDYNLEERMKILKEKLNSNPKNQININLMEQLVLNYA
jgi:hypothetical protein